MAGVMTELASWAPAGRGFPYVVLLHQELLEVLPFGFDLFSGLSRVKTGLHM